MLDESLENEIAEIAATAGCELLHLDFKGGLLKVVLDHPEGVRLEHCETVSRQTSALLDVSDWGKGRYTLEVTSPGLDRELYSAKDYERFVGEVVKVTFRPAGGKRTVIGRLQRFAGADGGETAAIEVRTDNEHLTIPLGSIDTARLVPEYSQPEA